MSFSPVKEANSSLWDEGIRFRVLNEWIVPHLNVVVGVSGVFAHFKNRPIIPCQTGKRMILVTCSGMRARRDCKPSQPFSTCHRAAQHLNQLRVRGKSTHINPLRALREEILAELIIRRSANVKLPPFHVRLDAFYALREQLGGQEVGDDDAAVADDEVEDLVQRLGGIDCDEGGCHGAVLS